MSRVCHSFPINSINIGKAIKTSSKNTTIKNVSSLLKRHGYRTYIADNANKTDKMLLKNLLAMKKRKEPITMITCYDTSQAVLADKANIDTVLVGDSCANVMMGLKNTNQITLDAIIHHTKAVSRGVNRAYLVADMPFGTYLTINDAVRNAGRLIGEGGASCVKLEGYVPDSVREISRFVPVCSHLGLLPQTADCFGTRGRTYRDIKELAHQSLKLQDNGASFLVLEKVCAETASYISNLLEIPTIGIGSGPHCDGQVLVWHDMLGLNGNNDLPYKFVKKYANLSPSIISAISDYVGEVKGGLFPTPQHSYYLSDKTINKLKEDDEIWDELSLDSQTFFDQIKNGHYYYYHNDIENNDKGNDNDPSRIERYTQLLPSQRSKKYTKVVASASELRNIRNNIDNSNADNDSDHRKEIVFVPFLGGLHSGHLELINEAKKYSSTHQIWTSLFLNPLQFNDINDYLKYPSSMENDIEALTKLGVDVIFTPHVTDMYPFYNVDNNTNDNKLFGPFVDFENIETLCDEGISRPGHFKGVGTVLNKLFAWIRPHKSIYGQKDFMQCVIIKNLVKEFFPDTKIIIHPTVRDDDGLALSSRNDKLSKQERENAPKIYHCLSVVTSLLFDNLHNNEIITVSECQNIGKKYAKNNNVSLEYISLHNFENGMKLDDNMDVGSFVQSNQIVISIAGSVGPSTRLIDNIVIGDKSWDGFKHLSLK